MKSEPLTPDSQVVLLLCSTLGLQRTASAPKPLSRSEWNDLARTIGGSALRRPGALLGLTGASIQQALGVPVSVADRLAVLMSRGGQLSIEVERLQALGIWVLTRADDNYPVRLRERLKAQAPPVLFGAGPAGLLNSKGVAIVGSRNVDNAGALFASTLGQWCAASDLTVISGGARGVDRLAMDGALGAGGSAVAVLADSLDEAIRKRETREHVVAGRLTLVTPLHPSVKFTVAAAMGRNKLIYGLASWAVVVASDMERGGTWAGAIENLRAQWVPLFVRDEHDAPPGNRALLERGARALTLEHVTRDAASWFESNQGEAAASLVREVPIAYAPESAQAEEPVALDLFRDVWPRVAGYLVEPRTEQEVAARFGLEIIQARAWLARGVHEGLLRELANPVRFQSVAAESRGQTSLFGS